MRELRSCEGCGASRFAVTESFAVELGAGVAEIVHWRCEGCGDETRVVGALNEDGFDGQPRAGRAA